MSILQKILNLMLRHRHKEEISSNENFIIPEVLSTSAHVIITIRSRKNVNSFQRQAITNAVRTGIKNGNELSDIAIMAMMASGVSGIIINKTEIGVEVVVD